MTIKQEIIKIIEKQSGLAAADIEEVLTQPPQRHLGNFSFPCFLISQKEKRSPKECAEQLKEEIESKGYPIIEKVQTVGPYLNFFINFSAFAQTIIDEAKNISKWKGTEKEKVFVEFAQPNTNKPLHVGHVRNISLGDSVSRIMTKTGNAVTKININNDRGVHICKSMLAYKKWGNNAEPDKKSDHFVGDFYVLYNQKVKEQPEIEEEIRKMLQDWENNDPEVRALWEKMNKWAFDGFKVTFEKLGIRFDREEYESDVYKEGKEIVKSGLKKGIFFKRDDGAIAIDLSEQNLGEKVLMRGDGTSIYITMDLQLGVLRDKELHFTKGIYVVGNEQDYHFQVLFEIFKKLGYPWAKNLYHLSYGMVNLPEGKMKSREGTVVDADDFIKEIEGIATEEINKRYIDLSQKEISKRAHEIALGAIKFRMLQVNPKKTIVYDPKQSISFEGDTGPYCQYVYARCSAILKKAGKVGKADYTLLTHEKETDVLFLLQSYKDTIKKAAEEYNPSIVAQYCIDLCQVYNQFYENCPVLTAESSDLKNARLGLVTAIKETLKDALSLLGIEVLEQM